MKRTSRPVLVAIWVAVALTAAVAAEDMSGVPPQFALIEAAREEGRIDDAQALFHRLQFAFDGEHLPVEFRPADRTPLRCGTALVAEYEARRADLPADMVKTIDAWLMPPAADKVAYISPSGRFNLTYATTGGSAVPLADTSPANGIPDYVERVGTYLDTAWNVEITTWGFTPPLLTPYYSVSFVAQSGIYGYCQVVGSTTRIVLDNDYVGYPPNDDTDGDALGAAKVTCAHEFKHASQFRTSTWSEGGWIELDGTWAEDLVFDATNDYYGYLVSNNGIAAPTLSLDAGGTGSYDDCIWQHWMSETWTPQVIVDFWGRRAANPGEGVLATYDAILETRGSSIAAGFPIFAAWNYATGARAITGIGYGEASTYPTSDATVVSAYPHTTSGTLNQLAARFFHCEGFEPGEPGSLRLVFNGDDSQPMALSAVIARRDGSGLIETIALNAANDADMLLSVPLAELERVGLVVVNAGVIGSGKSYALEVSRLVPAAVANVTPGAVSATIMAGAQGAETVVVGNVGQAGSQLDFSAHVMDAPLALAARAGGSEEAKAERRPGGRAVPGGHVRTGSDKQAHVTPLVAPMYDGDCRYGTFTGQVQGHYDTWWTGNESYAVLLDPANHPACTCGSGFNVRALHMALHLAPGSAPAIRASLAAGDDGCDGPGAVLQSSAPLQVTNITAEGYYDVEIPVDFSCRSTAGTYYIIFEFLNTAGPVGIPVNFLPRACVNFNNWGEGWGDLVSEFGMVGDLLMWADVDCCEVASATVLSPNGGEALVTGGELRVDWTATLMTEVQVTLSRNGGLSWETLAGSTPNDGTQTFTLTGPSSTNCLVRVSSPDGAVGDVSDGPFWIYGTVPWLTVSPVGGVLEAGASQPLTLTFDTAGLAAGVHLAWLVLLDNAATSPESVPVSLTVMAASAAGAVPGMFAMRGAAPNPFNPATRLTYSLSEAGQAVVDVLDLQGRLVRTLVSGPQAAGEQTVEWDGRDAQGRPVASGSYLARLRAGGQTATHKLTLAK
jgi:hypothetical protein